MAQGDGGGEVRPATVLDRVVERLADLGQLPGPTAGGVQGMGDQGRGNDHQHEEYTVQAVHAVIYSGLYSGGVSFYMPHCDAAV